MSEATVTEGARDVLLRLEAGIVDGSLRSKRAVITMGASTALTLSADQGNAVVLALTTASIIGLPLAADAPGMEVTVINVGADGAAKVSISPEAADNIVGTVVNAAADAVSVAAVDKDWDNTAATANKGDRCTVISDGVLSWFIVEGAGIWVSES